MATRKERALNRVVGVLYEAHGYCELLAVISADRSGTVYYQIPAISYRGSHPAPHFLGLVEEWLGGDE